MLYNYYGLVVFMVFVANKGGFGLFANKSIGFVRRD